MIKVPSIKSLDTKVNVNHDTKRFIFLEPFILRYIIGLSYLGNEIHNSYIKVSAFRGHEISNIYGDMFREQIT